MPKISFSTKRLQIDKANTVIVATVAVAVFVAIFSLFATRALLSKRDYQGRVIEGKSEAVKQLKENLETRDDLVNAYKQLVDAPENMLGGNPKGSGEKDGDNAKLILDALPSKYDFPALASSLEKILSDNSFANVSIGGSDDEIAQQQAAASSPNPEVVDIPFNVSVDANYDSAQTFLSIFEKSIRPFKIKSLNIQGTNANLKINVDATTFYLPEKGVNISKKEVK